MKISIKSKGIKLGWLQSIILSVVIIVILTVCEEIAIKK